MLRMINDYEVEAYKDKWIVATTFGYRVKTHPLDDNALHHGTFDTVEAARNYIDSKESSQVILK